MVGAGASRRKPAGPRVLVILDGASEPLGGAPTSLERAATPTLDALAREGELSRLRTVAPWLPAGSESAIPALLGWVPDAPLDRGMVEAAARGLEVGPGESAWRVDVRDPRGARGAAWAVKAARAALAARLPEHRVTALGGHRLLVIGGEPATLPELPPEIVLHPWPVGALPPRVHDETTVVVGAAGAAAGIARLMGAGAVVPRGATGRPGGPLAGKARAALDALAGGLPQVVVHVGAPDEAAHERDAAAKVAAIERADAELIAPLAAAVREAGGTLRVCPDHGCDPRSGRHDADPVPCLDWAAEDAAQSAPHQRLTERAVMALPVTELVQSDREVA